MSRRIHIVVLLFATMLFTGCEALKGFMSRDLADEDFIIGQLYVDEMVRETPVISSRTLAEQRPVGGRSNALGLTYSASDNAALYEAVASWLGVPYKYGGDDRSGIDCSAFVGAIYNEVYKVTLRRTTNDMLRDVTLVAKRDLQEGDLLFFTNSKGKVAHVGIYLKDNLFAHASTSNGVSVSRLSDNYWQSHFYKGGRVNR